MKSFFVALFILNCSYLFAQSKDLDGVWVLQQKEHVTGPENINALPTQFTFSRTKDSLIVEFTNITTEGKKSKGRVASALDGRETVIITSTNRKVKRKLQPSGVANEFVLTSAFYMPDNENEVDFTRVETLKMIDGKLHINKKSIETRSETWKVKGVFEKVK